MEQHDPVEGDNYPYFFERTTEFLFNGHYVGVYNDGDFSGDISFSEATHIIV